MAEVRIAPCLPNEAWPMPGTLRAVTFEAFDATDGTLLLANDPFCRRRAIVVLGVPLGAQEAGNR